MSKTLAETLAARETMYVNCGHPICCKSTELDIQALIDRLGADHGSMHQDLVGIFGCSKCKAAGRDRRPVFFTVVPDYEGSSGSGIATGSRPSIEVHWNVSDRQRFVLAAADAPSVSSAEDRV